MHVMTNENSLRRGYAIPYARPVNVTKIWSGRDLTFPDTLTTQGLPLWCFNIVGGEILTFPDTLTTQGLSLWCFTTM